MSERRHCAYCNRPTDRGMLYVCWRCTGRIYGHGPYAHLFDPKAKVKR